MPESTITETPGVGEQGLRPYKTRHALIGLAIVVALLAVGVIAVIVSNSGTILLSCLSPAQSTSIEVPRAFGAALRDTGSTVTYQEAKRDPAGVCGAALAESFTQSQAEQVVQEERSQGHVCGTLRSPSTGAEWYWQNTQGGYSVVSGSPKTPQPADCESLEKDLPAAPTFTGVACQAAPSHAIVYLDTKPGVASCSARGLKPWHA